jgi:non-ribosomal peptide synthetase component F
MIRRSSAPHTGASLAHSDNTYNPAELTAAIDATQNDFGCHGINADSVVVLRMDLTDRYVIALIAATELGCCVVPVDPATPPAMLDRMMAATAASALVDDAGITVCEYPPTAASAPAVLREHLEDAAYVLFTSGSTAEPKGVVGTRSGLNNRMEWGARQYFSADVNRCAVKTNPVFIDSLTEILCAYRCGRAMIVAPLEAQRDLGLLCDFISSAEIEQITMTPSCIPVLAAVGGDRLRRVRRWIFSGEELRRSWLAQARSFSPAAEMINSYGSTEVCGDATYFVLAAHDPIPDIVPIGQPATGVSVRIDAAAAEPDPALPSARSGELWIGGIQVAHGYLQSAHAGDISRFVRTPDDTHWFRTGDIVYESAGRLYFVGRTGDIYKVRGRRISLAGVAEALEAVDGVREAHAWVNDFDGESSLRAGVIPEPGASLTAASVMANPDRRSCRIWFPIA